MAYARIGTIPLLPPLRDSDMRALSQNKTGQTVAYLGRSTFPQQKSSPESVSTEPDRDLKCGAELWVATGWNTYIFSDHYLMGQGGDNSSILRDNQIILFVRVLKYRSS